MKKKELKKKRFPLGSKNYAFFIAGIVSIIVGFIFLARGDITIAPILLVFGYCVLIPVAFFVRFNGRKKETTG